MRSLYESELESLHKRLESYLGHDSRLYTSASSEFEFVVILKNVYLVKKSVLKTLSNIPKKLIYGVGTHVGKVTRGKQVLLSVGFLKVLEKHSTKKVFLTENKEAFFLHGNNVLKGMIEHMDKETKKNDKVVIYKNLKRKEFAFPIGLGTSNVASTELEHIVDNARLAIYWNADVGEYLRKQQELF